MTTARVGGGKFLLQGFRPAAFVHLQSDLNITARLPGTEGVDPR
jgi:hypothetical protein